MELIAQIAYFAGIVDGEGTIQIIKQGKGDYVTTGFYVTNSNLALLSVLQSQFGGNITKARQRVGKNWKPVQRLQFYGSLAERLVRMIQPYLIAKREQANLFLRFRDRIGLGMHPLTAEERATRFELYRQCQKANKRGIGQAERLSEEAPRRGQPRTDDAIVRTHGKQNHEKPAETTGSIQ